MTQTQKWNTKIPTAERRHGMRHRMNMTKNRQNHTQQARKSKLKQVAHAPLIHDIFECLPGGVSPVGSLVRELEECNNWRKLSAISL